ncbi:TrmH family RNA methyltransferase [Leptothrix ochracea]|uniref:TrmH family RNA methyltransferase n=1 Tax=Leptothrix ochracea TaxID=735331 RepID=UPI0034E2D8B8
MTLLAPRLIDSAANAWVKELRRLVQDPTGYRRQGRIWLEGDHLARAFLARGGAPRTAVFSRSAWDDPNLRALALHVPDVVVLSDVLMAQCSTLESPPPLGFLIDVPGQEPGHAPRSMMTFQTVATVVLDRLQDAGNVGTILRSAAALGVRQVLALKGTAALWSPKVLRAGMGAHFALSLHEGLSADDLAALPVPLLATSSHATSDPLHRLRLPQPCAWVFGHEGQGVSPALMARCAHTVTIPQPGGEESLNVAAAAAICFYEAARQTVSFD